MTEFWNKAYQKYRNFILYGAIGIITTAIDVAVFNVFANWYFDLHWMLSNTISYLVAMVFSFFLNRKYNFKVKDHIWSRFFSFSLINVIGFTFSQIFVYTFIPLIGLNEFWGKLFATILAAIGQFVFIKKITFKSK